MYFVIIDTADTEVCIYNGFTDFIYTYLGNDNIDMDAFIMELV
jgi:hypothetical protein